MSDESDWLRNARIKQEIEAARKAREQRAQRTAPRAGPSESEENAAFNTWFKNSKYGKAEEAYKPPPPPPSPHATLLGLPAVFTADELKKAYRAKAMLTHPDRGGSAAAFNAVQNAYEKLVPHVRPPPK